MRRIIIMLGVTFLLASFILLFYVGNSSCIDVDGNIISIMNDNELLEIDLNTGNANLIYENPQYSHMSDPCINENKVLMCVVNDLTGEWEIIELDYITKEIKTYYSTSNKISHPIRIDETHIIFLMMENNLWFLNILDLSNNSSHKLLEEDVLNTSPSISSNKTILISLNDNKNGLICEVDKNGVLKTICEGKNAIWINGCDIILYNFQQKVFALEISTNTKKQIISDTVFFTTPIVLGDYQKIMFIDYDEVGFLSGASKEYCFILDINTNKKIKLIDLFLKNNINISNFHYNIGISGMCFKMTD